MPADLDKAAVEDLTAAADLIQLSWKDNRDQVMDYTPDFLHGLFSYPGDRPVVAPAYYDGGRMVAFVAGFPRRIRIQGEIRNLLLMTFFTVAPGYKGKGLGRGIWADCLRDARRAGYDGALHYCVDTNPSNAITLAGARAAGFEARRIFTVRYLMSLLNRRSEPVPDDAETSESTSLFLHAVASLGSGIPLKREWNTAEANWLGTRQGSIVTTHPDGAALSGYSLRTANSSRTPCFFFEDVLWERINLEQRTLLLRRCLARASESAELAVVPVLEYTDLSPFTAAGFRRSRRVLNAYLTLWTDPSSHISEAPCMYSDVL